MHLSLLKNFLKKYKYIRNEVCKVLYIVRVIDNGYMYEYEYGNLPHAEDQYNWEKSAEMWLYEDGKETLIKSK